MAVHKSPDLRRLLLVVVIAFGIGCLSTAYVAPRGEATLRNHAAAPALRKPPTASATLRGENQQLPAERSALHQFAAFAAALVLTAAVTLQGSLPISLPAQAFEELTSEELQTVDLFQRSTPGVVYITTEVFKIASAGKNMEIQMVPQGSGSGWVYDNEGHIVTNYHVIESAQAVTVKFIEGTEVLAKVVGADPYSDVAVLQADVPDSRKALLRPLGRGSSASLRVGQEVLAIGNPFGLDHTLTKGIVSGVGRTIQSVGGRPIQGAIQTDASINPGNSGGPLLNSRGQVIGMNTVIISPSGASAGVGFAIPSDTVAARVASILKFGYVKRPSLGLYLGQDGLAKRLSGRPGGLIAGLQSKGSADAAGLKPGDIIFQSDDRKISTVNDIFAVLDEHQPGDTVKVHFIRPDKPEDLGVPGAEVRFAEGSVDVLLKEAQAST